MDQFVYHRVVDTMRGTALYPLNRLKDIYPDIYAEHAQKYVGREHVMEGRIPPPLDCLWNDVLHFTAVPPEVLYRAIADAGFDADMLVWKRWYKIPAAKLDPTRTMVCLFRQDVAVVSEARDFHPYDPLAVAQYGVVPPETQAYYRAKHAAGERPLFFHRVPHVLYKGAMDIAGAEIVTPSGLK